MVTAVPPVSGPKGGETLPMPGTGACAVMPTVAVAVFGVAVLSVMVRVAVKLPGTL